VGSILTNIFPFILCSPQIAHHHYQHHHHHCFFFIVSSSFLLHHVASYDCSFIINTSILIRIIIMVIILIIFIIRPYRGEGIFKLGSQFSFKLVAVMIQMIKEPRELQLSSSSSMTETAIQAGKFINKEEREE
jgi:hypothetical protein